MVSTSVNSSASKSLTEDTVCNISEYEEVEVAPHISPPPQPDLNTDSESTRAVAAEVTEEGGKLKERARAGGPKKKERLRLFPLASCLPHPSHIPHFLVTPG